MNIGERNELFLKIRLVMLRDSGTDHLGPFKIIESVGFDHCEYGKLPANFNLATLSLLDDDKLTQLSLSLNIRKAGGRSKSDVYINKKGYSVKSLASSPPALVNHTCRPGFEFACRYAGVNIEELDKLVKEYWKLRKANVIGEDIKNNDQRSPFREAKHVLAPILEYFLFNGTGAGLSDHPAEYIIDYSEPLDERTWVILDKRTAIDELWDRLIFCVRAKKGMPENYPHNRDKSKNESIAVWTEYSSEEYRGALHIRAITH